MKRILFLQKPELLPKQRDEVVALLRAAWADVAVDCAGSPDEVPSGAHYDAVITPTLPWLPDALARCAGYDWIHFLSAGVERIFEMRFPKDGVTLTKSSGVHAIPIAEYVLGAMLHFAKNFDQHLVAARSQEWHPVWSDELTGKTVLVLGAGAVGSEVARRCAMLGMKTLSVGRAQSSSLSSRDLAAVQYLVVCVPLTDETRGLVDQRVISRLAPGAVLIDVSRGGVVNAAAVLEALSSKHLRGAALDVFEAEPLPKDSPLWQQKNVIISPHIAGTTPHYMMRAIEIFIANARRRDAGQDLLTPVDLGAGY